MENKVAIVTGGGQGIGRGIALRLSKDGYSVIINGRTQSKLDKVAEEIKNNGGTAITFAGDVSNRTVNEQLVK
ncbi:SDR family NAD(P)-dependent oxidoreductase, partial [Liquorilactobacillus sicerae]|uniref:SDR family NAD(P)-dependent oxidoreductase n=1 Tax=Liquorilactobacillus sicerae TaxID=1416943 RepID=UPI002480746B